jgi:C4-dicarboxylate transporter DctQ subunit
VKETKPAPAHKKEKKVLTRIIEKVSVISGWLSGIGIYIMVGIIFLDVILRYFFKSGTNVSDDVSVYAMVFVAFVGAAWTTKLGKHVSVDILFQRFPKTTQVWVHAITTCVSTLILFVVSWSTVNWVIYLRINGWSSVGMMNEPMWIPLSAIPIGFVLWSLQYVVESYKAIILLSNHLKGQAPVVQVVKQDGGY